MKFICFQENLKQGLNVIEKIVGKNPSLPVLNNVLIITQKDSIKLCSTDLEIGISCWIAGKVEKEGTLCVPVKILSSYINSLPNKKIEINSRENKLNLKCENYKASIVGFNSEDFPIIPQIKEKEFISLNSFKLCQGFSKVIGAVASSDIKPEISGVFVKLKKDFIKLVSTDSFRLAEKTIFFEKPLSFEKSVIIPAKTVMEVIRIFGETEQSKSEIDLYLSSNQILFSKNTLPKIHLISRLIEGEYPGYEEIIPKDFLTKVLLERQEFLQHIKIAGLFTTRTNDIKIKVNPAEKSMEFLSSNSDTGENKSEISAQIEGEKIEIIFNCKYLMDGLMNIDDEQVILELNGDEKPGVLKPYKKGEYVYIIMPIKPT
ncbi:MAG: DNA polymerase III subunit beta [Parcubacteria group bacterium CG11_big_fil_rev_8_21_14_0_20_39_14]|nr:MAG: DNA polymerase III subunit beta [Parcubacteria group bacterium CG11_big_fil_rev_8_21_14_0_20_39_14]PIS35532.1 MAG: DNA polymerase III subunit beta [Parcubacteria group bacterium CG08_land_8_20_14_0_20_38_56]